MRGQERSEEEDKSRETEGNGGRERPQRRLMKKVASKLDLEDTWRAIQVKGWGTGSTSGEEGSVLLPGQSLRGWDSGVWTVLQARLPGKRGLEPGAKSSQRFLRRE